MATSTKGSVRTALLAFIKQAERAFNSIPKSRGGVMLGTAIIGDTQYNLDRDMNEVRNRTGAAIAALREALSAEQKGWMSRVRPSITEASQHFGYTNNRYIRNYVSHYADMAALAAKFNALYNGLRNLSMQLGSYSRGEETPGVLSMSAKTTSGSLSQIARLYERPIVDCTNILQEIQKIPGLDSEVDALQRTIRILRGDQGMARSGSLYDLYHSPSQSMVLGYLANRIQGRKPTNDGNDGRRLHAAAMLRMTNTKVKQLEDMIARLGREDGKSVGQPSDGVMSATAKAFRKSRPVKGVSPGAYRQVAQLQRAIVNDLSPAVYAATHAIVGNDGQLRGALIQASHHADNVVALLRGDAPTRIQLETAALNSQDAYGFLVKAAHLAHQIHGDGDWKPSINGKMFYDKINTLKARQVVIGNMISRLQ